jgi:hypothetical protein
MESTPPAGAPGCGWPDANCRAPVRQIEELWLQAQSVPSASRIPCVRDVFRGAWLATSTRVTNGRSVLELVDTTSPNRGA